MLKRAHTRELVESPNMDGKHQDGVKFAIVVQGPDYGDRTFKIAQYLRDNNDDRTDIVLALWKREDTEARYSPLVASVTGKARVHVVATKEPRFAHNVMHRYSQRESTRRGVDFAVNKLGATHVLKLRSDNLMRIPNACAYLLELQARYGPVPKPDWAGPVEPRRQRLIVSQTGCTETGRWGNFHVSDHWMFGRASEMTEWYEDPENCLNGGTKRHLCECLPPQVRDKMRPDPQMHTPAGISPEPDFAQFWIATHNVDVSDMRDLLSRYFILVSNTDVDLVHKTFALDSPMHGPLAMFWVNYTDSMAPTAAVWREWVKTAREASH